MATEVCRFVHGNRNHSIDRDVEATAFVIAWPETYPRHPRVVRNVATSFARQQRRCRCTRDAWFTLCPSSVAERLVGAVALAALPTINLYISVVRVFVVLLSLELDHHLFQSQLECEIK